MWNRIQVILSRNCTLHLNSKTSLAYTFGKLMNLKIYYKFQTKKLHFIGNPSNLYACAFIKHMTFLIIVQFIRRLCLDRKLNEICSIKQCHKEKGIFVLQITHICTFILNKIIHKVSCFLCDFYQTFQHNANMRY